MAKRVQYRLADDPEIRWTIEERKVAFDRMAQYGKWDKSCQWWTPCRSQKPLARIEREGYIVLETR